MGARLTGRTLPFLARSSYSWAAGRRPGVRGPGEYTSRPGPSAAVRRRRRPARGSRPGDRPGTGGKGTSGTPGRYLRDALRGLRAPLDFTCDPCPRGIVGGDLAPPVRRARGRPVDRCPTAWSVDARTGIRAVAAIVLGAMASAGLVWLYMRVRLDPLVEAAERLVAGDARRRSRGPRQRPERPPRPRAPLARPGLRHRPRRRGRPTG